MSSRLQSAWLVTCIAAQMAAQDPGPGVHRFTLGRMEITCLQDGRFELPVSLLSGIEPAKAVAMLGGKDKAPTPVNAFLVKTATRLVLVDTGAGTVAGEDTGALPKRLKAAGVDPAKVDLVLITHFHMDHVGGLVKPDGTRAFPNAVVRVARAENDYWLGDPGKLTERGRANLPALKAATAPYMAAGAYRPFAPGEDLGEGIRAIPAEGHTPGHTCYAFVSEGKEFWCLGDLIHFGAIQFSQPAVAVSFDTDSPRAVAARQEIFKRAVQAKAVVAGAHLAFPGVFRLSTAGDGFSAAPFPGSRRKGGGLE